MVAQRVAVDPKVRVHIDALEAHGDEFAGVG